MQRIFVLSACLFLCAPSVSAVYPATYPFENESLEIGTPLAETPSYTYDDDDVGGYIYTHTIASTFTLDHLPFVFMDEGMSYHRSAVRKGVTARPPREAWVSWNCTEKGESNLMGPAAFPGNLADQKICEEGECCAAWFGLYGYWGGAEHDEWQHNAFNEEYAAGVCTAEITESLYCAIMEFWTTKACVETVVSITERTFVMSCYDDYFHHLMQCPIYVETGLYYVNNEPEQYISKSTGEQINANNALLLAPDRMCHPYSYYFPELAKSADDTSSDGANSGDAGSSSGSEANAESSSAAVGITISVGLILLSVV